MAGISYEEVEALALAMSDTEPSLSYRTPCVKRKGKLMVRYRPDIEALVVRTDWERHDELLERLEVFKTDHYEGWPYVLVSLADLGHDLAKELLQVSWEAAPNKDKRRPLA
ncbi:MAG: MmcQ/YjbR family DNA-binding protein [bacterium]